ncbi:hypothetical protein CSKR_107667 [Clonorchis sinensis]|uniref:Uncharacterized protein n=1 Tax=Clonorchis sinensis TaxID=79923 RepID=A0A419PTL4_CLOSI|nr:hypothetical protein CSKR_107667 [Clonorchis sinensis]
MKAFDEARCVSSDVVELVPLKNKSDHDVETSWSSAQIIIAQIIVNRDEGNSELNNLFEKHVPLWGIVFGPLSLEHMFGDLLLEWAGLVVSGAVRSPNGQNVFIGKAALITEIYSTKMRLKFFGSAASCSSTRTEFGETDRACQNNHQRCTRYINAPNEVKSICTALHIYSVSGNNFLEILTRSGCTIGNRQSASTGS